MAGERPDIWRCSRYFIYRFIWLCLPLVGFSKHFISNVGAWKHCPGAFEISHLTFNSMSVSQFTKFSYV